MKKFYAFLAGIIMAIGSAFAQSPFDCNIAVTDITDSYALVTITPADNSQYYIFSCTTKAAFDDTNEAELTDYMKSNMDYYIELYAENGYAISYSDFAYQGVKFHEYKDLAEDTEYVVFAYRMDPATGEPASSFATTTFTTKKGDDVPVIGEYDLHVISPSWKDKVATEGWWQISGYGNDYDFWVTISNSFTTKLEGTYQMADLDLSYSKVYEYDEEGQPVEIKAKDITAVVAVSDEGVVTVTAEYLAKSGVLYHITFDNVEPDGIGSITVTPAPATRKYLDNNSIVIEKDGRKFNLNGQVMK